MLLVVASGSVAQERELAALFPRDAWETYLERADRQADEQGWLSAARKGSDAALRAWERDALIVCGDPAQLDEARGGLEGLIEAELDRRHSQWLVKRFFDRLPAASLAAFHAAVRSAHLAHLYVSSDGAIELEEATGDPRLKDAEGLAADRTSWRAGVLAGVEEVLASWKASMEAAAPELLASVPAPGREAAGVLLAGFGERAAEGLRRELDALFAQEEAGFVARRLSDSYSLRRKSEQAAAQSIASRLIEDTRALTDQGIRALEETLRQQPENPAGEARIDAQQWQRSFAIALEAGLATWDAAEEKLLVERVEWERQAGKDYTDGERAWAAAWQELRSERADWEADLRRVLAAGEADWREQQADLAAAIHQAAAELERETQARTASKSQEIEGLVDMFAQASSMVATAQSSGRYWLDKIKVDLGLDAAYEQIAAAARAPTDGSSLAAALEQVRYWQGVLDTSTDHVEAAREQLIRVYAVILDDDGQESPLLSVLSEEDPGSLLLDEYQVELLKARAVEQYWEGQLQIAQAVDDYARDLSSGRATEAESERRYRDALAGYAAEREAYGAAVVRLEEAGAALAGRQAEVQEALAETRRASDALERARSDYDSLFALYASGGGEFFAEKLRDCYLSLLDLMGLGGEDGEGAREDDLGAVVADYLTAARRYGLQESISLASARIGILVRGSPQTDGVVQGLASLAELREAASGIQVPTAESLPENSAALGVSDNHPCRGLLDALLARQAGAAGLEKEFWISQCIRLVQMMKADAEQAVDAREDAIRLLSAASGTEWFASSTGRLPAAGYGIGEAVEEAAGEISGALLLARAQDARDGLARWGQWSAEGLPSGLDTDADLLAFALRLEEPQLTAAEAAARETQLELLIGFLQAGSADLISRREELRAFLQGKPWLSDFVSGRAGFLLAIDGTSLDCSPLCALHERQESERARGLCAAWDLYSIEAPCLGSEREAEGRALISRTLSRAGIRSFVDPAEVLSAIPSTDARQREEWIAALASGLREAEQHLFPWQAARVEDWLSRIVACAAISAARFGPGLPVDQSGGQGVARAEEDLQALMDQAEAVGELRSLLVGSSDTVARLAGLLSALRRDVGGSGTLAAAKAAGITVEAMSVSLLRAGAVTVASHMLGSGSDPADEGAWAAALEACIGAGAQVPDEIEAGILSRARELLGIQLALDGIIPPALMTGVQRAACATALWTSGAVGRAAAAVHVAPEAESILALHGLIDAGTSEEEIDAWAAGLAIEPARSAVRSVRAQLARSPREQADDIFLSALCIGDVRGSIEEFRQLEPVGGAVLERAAALSIAGQLGQHTGPTVLGLIEDLSGLSSHGAIDVAFFGNPGLDPQREAFSLAAGEPLSAEALAFLIRKEALDGGDTAGLAAGLAGSLREEVDSFLSLLRDQRGYLPGLDEGEAAYVERLPGGHDADDRSLIISAIRLGAWNDPFFTATLGESGTSSRFLTAILDMECGASGAAAALASLATDCLAEIARTLEDSTTRLAAVLAYRQRLDLAIRETSNQVGSYRGYLLAENLETGDEGQTLFSGIAAAPQTLDQDTITHSGNPDPVTRGLENQLLEAFNQLGSAGAAIDKALGRDDEVDAEGLAALVDFAIDMTRFTSVVDPVSIWESGDEFAVPAGVCAEFSGAQATLEALLRRIADHEQEIERLGSALGSWRASAEAEPDAGPLEEARRQSASAQEALTAAIAGFAAAASAYDQACGATQAASEALEEAGLERDIQQEIRDFAASGYLTASGEISGEQGGWSSPAEQLLVVQQRRDRAQAALDVLVSLVDTAQITRGTGAGEYVDAREQYREALEDYLSLRRVQGDLLEEVTRQQAAVAARREEFAQIAQRIMNASATAYASSDPRVTAETLEAVLDPEDADNPLNAYAAAYFCRLDPDHGLRLSFDSESYVLSKNTDWESLRRYMTGEPGDHLGPGISLETDLQRWVTGLDALLSSSADPTGVLMQWGLAAGYVKQRLREANEGSTDTAQRTAVLALGAGSGAEMLANDRQLGTFLSGNVDTTVDLDCAGYVRQQGQAALAAMSSDEKELFQFYLAMDALGATRETGAHFFRDSSVLAAWGFLAERLSESAAAHLETAKEYGEIGAALWFTGILMNILPGAGVPLMAEAALLFGIALSEQTRAESYTSVSADARSRLSGEGSLGAAVAESGSALSREVDAGAAVREALLAEQARLASLEGPGWTAGLTDIPEDLALLIARQLEAAEPGSTTTADILSSLVHASDLARIEALQALQAATGRAQENETAALYDYNQALSDFLAGGGAIDTTELAESARRAFSHPFYIGEDHGRWLFDLQSDLALEPAAIANVRFEEARGEVLSDLKSTLVQLFQQRMQALGEVRQAEWELKTEELSRARETWSAKMGLLVSRATADWTASEARLRDELGQWQEEFAEQYRQRSEDWDGLLLGFQESKCSWVDETALKAARVGNEQILAEVGESALAGSRESAGRLVAGLSLQSIDPRELLARILPSGTLTATIDRARQYADRIASTGIVVTRGLLQSGSEATSLGLVRAFVAEGSEELSRRGALIVADQAAESLREAREGYRELVREANEGFEADMDRLFLGAGYAKGAGTYAREGIVSSTVLSGVVRERQEVAGYRPFPVPSFDVDVDLGGDALGGLSAEGIQARLAAAIGELDQQREQIFGSDDETDSEKAARQKSLNRIDYTVDVDDGFWGELWEGVTSLFGSREFGYTKVEQSWAAGSFGAHIGYGPVFVGVPDPDKSYAENILEPGSGELDHLLGWYGYWEMRVGKGLTELNAALYDKPLWNDQGSAMQAPTMREVADLGVGVAAALTGNGWAIAALNLADDAFFGLMDAAGGYRDIGEIGLDLGRKAILGVATAGISGIGGIGSHVLGAATGNVLGGLTNAITWSEQEGWGWDSRVFAGGVVGRQAFGGFLGSTAGALIGGAFSGVTDKLTAGLTTLAAGFGGEAVKWGYHLVAGALDNNEGMSAGQLALRALDDMGGLTLNIANVGALLDAALLMQETRGDFAAEEHSALALAASRLDGMGLLELRLGSSGARFALGTEGVDLGGSLYSLGKAAVVQSLVSTYIGSDGLKEVLRQVYAKGDFAAEATAWRVLSGKDSILEWTAEGTRAHTVSDSTGSRTIYLGAIGDGKWEALDAVVRLQHESWRNGFADANNGGETVNAIIAHTRLARELDRRNGGFLERAGYLQDEALLLSYAERVGDFGLFAQYAGQSYDSAADFWKLVRGKDGTNSLEFDGRADIYDESLNFLVGTGSMGVQTALSSYLGVSMTEAEQIMLQAGMQEDTRGYWNRSTVEANMGKRIAIRGVADPQLSSYLFAACNQGTVLDEIAEVVSGKGQSMSRAEMREYLRSMAPAWHDVGDTYQLRFQALRNTLISFYLGSGSVDAVQVRVSQPFGVADDSTRNLYAYHVGIDLVHDEASDLLAAWPGSVRWSDWSDRIGNVVEVLAGYSFEDQFVSAGFGFGVAHLSGRQVAAGNPVANNSLLGHSGNTGTQVTGPSGGFHTHFTVNDSEYGRNQYLTDILGLGNSDGWVNLDGTPWSYGYEPHDRRFYNPRRLYEQWFRN